MNHPDKEFILVIPLHSQISKDVLNQIIKDLGLTVEDFLKLVWLLHANKRWIYLNAINI